MEALTAFPAFVRTLSPHQLAALLATMTDEEIRSANYHWPSWAHPGQTPRVEDARVWVLMAGRGFGKTRAGAEWVANAARADGRLRIALVAASFADARSVMVEGQSGLLTVAPDAIESWLPTNRLLRFTSGAEARLFSGAFPGALRGPEHHMAWCDELAKWEKPQETWDTLQLGLRAGPNPRVLVTTTPRTSDALQKVLAAAGPNITGGATYANPHLPDAFIDAVTGMYANTRLGRQELEGELLPDVAGALWSIDLLEKCRNPLPLPLAGERRGKGRGAPVRAAPPYPQSSPFGGGGPAEPVEGAGAVEGALPFTQTVIGVDPPSGDGTCGIIACAKDTAGIAHVLADHSVTARTPDGWTRAAAAAAEAHNATLIVAEANQGGKMVEAVLKAAGVGTRVKLTHATQGKSARADPIATLFEAGRVRLAGRFRELEAELCGLIGGGGYEGPGTSPDRADAMVWALTELMLGAGERRIGVRVV